MRVHPAVLVLLVVVPPALSCGLFAMTSDVRAAIRTLDTLVNPPETIRPDPVVLIRGVRELARLETASVDVEQRVRAQRGADGTWEWLGERLEFVARGTVVAGVDLEKMAPSDLTVADDGAVVVRLPEVEIWHVDIDEEQSFVALRERGWFGIPDADLETECRREAVKYLRMAAEGEGITDRAQAQAEVVVAELLSAAGVEEVRFER